MNALRLKSTIGLLTLAVLLSACTLGTKKDANDFAAEACKDGKGISAMVKWSKASQLDSRWIRAANAHVDSQVFKAEVDRLSQYLDDNDPQYRNAELNWSRASFILISECAALKMN